MAKSEYIIRGGVEGRERLRILARVMRPTTLALLERAGMRAGMACLEIGCGGGDLAFDMARIVGAGGRVVGTDIDETKLEVAAREAEEQKLANIEFRFSNCRESARMRIRFGACAVRGHAPFGSGRCSIKNAASVAAWWSRRVGGH